MGRRYIASYNIAYAIERCFYGLNCEYLGALSSFVFTLEYNVILHSKYWSGEWTFGVANHEASAC